MHSREPNFHDRNGWNFSYDMFKGHQEPKSSAEGLRQRISPFIHLGLWSLRGPKPHHIPLGIREIRREAHPAGQLPLRTIHSQS